jgi:hypothetical protein
MLNIIKNDNDDYGVIKMKLKNNKIKKIITQLNYKPTGAFIDNRGKIIDCGDYDDAEERWSYRKFDYDKLQFKDDNNKNQSYITWKQAGFIMEDLPNFGFYSDHIGNKLPRELWSIMNVNNFLSAKYDIFLLFDTEDKFPSMVNKLKKLFNISEKTLESLDMKLADIGFPLIFEDENKRIKITFGPMEKEQMLSFFDYKEDLPSEALFVQIEFLTKENYINKADTKLLSKKVFDYTGNKIIPFIHKIVEGVN